MKILTLLCAMLLFAPFHRAIADDAPEVKITLAESKDADAKKVEKFTTDAKEIFANFACEGVKVGEKVRGVWIAEDVGAAAPKDTKIAEKILDAGKEDFEGNFSLTKPTKGWPVGKYRIEISIGSKVVATAKFSIEEADKK